MPQSICHHEGCELSRPPTCREGDLRDGLARHADVPLASAPARAKQLENLQAAWSTRPPALHAHADPSLDPDSRGELSRQAARALMRQGLCIFAYPRSGTHFTGRLAA